MASALTLMGFPHAAYNRRREMIENLSREQIQAMFDALPFQMVLIDANDKIQWWNESKGRLREAPADRLGRDVRDCHQPQSIPRLEKMLADFKSGQADEAEFWVVAEEIGLKALNRFFAIRSSEGKYLGTMEYLLNFGYIEQIGEEKKGAHVFKADPENHTQTSS
jgi:DUF438 domain-containing protein